MAEYIAKKLAIELMHQSSYMSDGDLLEVNGNLAKARIEAEPAADVAPVVRCKDCIHNNDCDIQYSAQPEPLTDKEQRIFLAAMGREEKVCKQVDEECRDCREPYEDSLVRVCHEIVRKVKGALWET